MAANKIRSLYIKDVVWGIRQHLISNIKKANYLIHCFGLISWFFAGFIKSNYYFIHTRTKHKRYMQEVSFFYVFC